MAEQNRWVWFLTHPDAYHPDDVVAYTENNEVAKKWWNDYGGLYGGSLVGWHDEAILNGTFKSPAVTWQKRLKIFLRIHWRMLLYRIESFLYYQPTLMTNFMHDFSWWPRI